jgi:hypothetical protein
MASAVRIVGAASLVLIGAAVAHGCGGSKDVTSLSREDFVSRADEVCMEAQRGFDRVQRSPAGTPQAAERQVEALIDVSRQALDELRAIAPPPELESDYELYLAARERALGFLEDGREAAADRDAQAYVRAKRRVAAEQGTRLQLAEAVGLADCSRPSITLGAG